jgi:F-type H+-transporting ATPase subunit b
MKKAVIRRRETIKAALLLILLLSAAALPAAEHQSQPVAERQAVSVQAHRPHDTIHAGNIEATEKTKIPEKHGEGDKHGAAHEPGMFDIDPVILVSQTINFFILLFLLKRFLFVPIGGVIEERRIKLGRIKLQTEAEHQKALELKQEYEKHIENIQEELYQIRQNAILDGNNRRDEIIEEANKKAKEIVEQGEMEIFMERQTAWARIREDVVQLTMMAAEKVVEASLDDEQHRRLIASTIERLANDLPDQETI